MPDSGFQTLSVQLGFRITIVKWNPESLSCFPNFNAHDSGIQNQTFPGFRIRKPIAKNVNMNDGGFLRA